jgi:hypothetical protein
VSDWERRALEDSGRYLAIIGVLTVAWAGARWRTSWLANAVLEPEFEDEPADRVVSLGVLGHARREPHRHSGIGAAIASRNLPAGFKREGEPSSGSPSGCQRYTCTWYEPLSGLTPVMSILRPDPAVLTELYGMAAL